MRRPLSTRTRAPFRPRLARTLALLSLDARWLAPPRRHVLRLGALGACRNVLGGRASVRHFTMQVVAEEAERYEGGGQGGR